MPRRHFVKLSPGGNITILLEAGELPAPERARASALLMRPRHLGAEQVGFMDLRRVPPSLEMMGGEFCLNATRALAHEMWRKKLFLPLRDSEDLFGLIRSSGFPGLVQARVGGGKKARPDSPVDCFLSLELEAGRETVQALEKGLARVQVPGIIHLLLDEDILPPTEDPLLEARDLLSRFGLTGEAACGVIRHRLLAAEAQDLHCSMQPVVHVAATDSYVRESSCGSGALALALYQAWRNGLSSLRLKAEQPGGEALEVRLERRANQLCLAEIGGPVQLIAEGETLLPA